MAILLIFAFLAGIVTVLSPCVLPVLPALLSAGGGKGHLRPLGIICGLIFSFTFFTLALTSIVQLTGVSPDFLRYIAIGLIALFGLLMIFPSLGEKFAEATSGVATLGQSVQDKSKLFGTGFWSGFILGIALGLVWTPCAGPILAAITTLVATSTISWFTFLMTLAYSIGAAIPMFLIIYGGQKIINSSKGLSKYSEWIRKGFGVLMILGALAIALHYDVKFQQFAIQYIPLINIENNSTVKNELDKLRDANYSNSNKEFILPPEEPLSNKKAVLPKIAAAPELSGITGWVNTDPFTLQELRGKVVLIDFWTYSCINCIRTFPYLKDWYAKYHDKGLVIVGVHTPEFEFEKNIQNVKDAANRFGLLYPIAIDSNFKTWKNYNNRFWPAHYLIDQMGVVRSFHFGEGGYMETENDIRNLLGMAPLEGKDEPVSHRTTTPETYLGYERGDKYAAENVIQLNENVSYHYTQPLKEDHIGLKGKWLAASQNITSRGESELDLNFLAPRVYLVMESETPQLVSVYLDGAPLEKKYYTDDMNDKGQILVGKPRKYDLINLRGQYERHKLTLQVPAGISMYAFTFGDEP